MVQGSILPYPKDKRRKSIALTVQNRRRNKKVPLHRELYPGAGQRISEPF